MRRINQLLFTCFIVILSSIFLASAINFGDPSPDVGEADFGANIGTFNTQSGNATDTRTDNNVYFAVGRSAGDTVAANQTLAFNISALTTNKSILITGINVSVRYCHTRTVTNTCNGGGGASPQGTAGNMNISIYNASGNSWFRLGTLNATTTADEITLVKNLTSLKDYGEFNNSQGLVNISFEFAWSGTGRSAFLNDHTNLTVMYDSAPVVTLKTPLNNSLVNPSTVTFNCSATDDFGLVNITLYHDLNGSRAFLANQTNFLGGTFNSTTFTLTNVPEYNVSVWNCLALDNNNLSSFAAVNFTIDTSGLNITPLSCVPLNINQNESMICNATITDNIAINNVTVNVTLPNGTIIAAPVQNTSSNYFFNFTQTGIDGRYNITWKANDTLNNNKSVTTTFFTVGNIAPNVTIISPINNTNSSNQTQIFTFNVTDFLDTSFSCSLILNETSVETNSSVNVNINSSFTVNNLGEGAQNWTVRCTDSGSLSDTAGTRTIIIDLSPPTFVSLTTIPNDDDGLDPQVDILVRANVTDNLTAVNNSLVLLETKRSNQNTFTQTTMTFDTTTGLYNATINENAAGTYNLRVNATDIVGNTGISNILNITLQRERTWTDSPSQLVFVASNFSINGSALYTINNTGDFTLTFNITSNYSLTLFNETEQFNLLAKALKTMNITATAGTGTFTRFKINTTAIDAADATIAGEPQSRITEATIVVAPGQPILVATITTAPTFVTQGDTNLSIVATLDNLGDGNATNVTFSVSLPSGWTVTSGSANLNIGDMISGDTATIVLITDIARNAATGNQTILANATGLNSTGSDLEALGLIFTDNQIIEVNLLPPTLGGGSGAEAGAGAGAGAGVAAAGGGPQPYITPTLKRTLFTEELLKTKETIEIVRGENVSFALKVTNVFENTTLTQVKLELKKYLSQYFDHVPFELNDVRYGQSKNFVMTITSPGYFTHGTYPLLFEISGLATGKFRVLRNNTFDEVSTIIRFTELRNVTLIVYEIEPKIAAMLVSKAKKNVEEMTVAGFPVKKATVLLKQIQKEYDNLEWQHMQVLAEELQQLSTTAFSAHDIIKELEDKINDAQKRGLDVSSTKKVVDLAKAVFDREDFETAKKRTEEGRLLEFLEVKGAFNVANFLARYWWALILVMLFTSASSYVAYRKLIIKIIDQRSQNLITEELNITQLIKELQEVTFKERKISIEIYHKRMYEYESRLEQIKATLSRLRTKRVGILTIEDQLSKLGKEEQAIDELIKHAQESYFVLKNISKMTYDQRIEEQEFRKSEIEEEIAVLETKLGKLIHFEKELDDDYQKNPTIHNYTKIIRHGMTKKVEKAVRFLHKL